MNANSCIISLNCAGATGSIGHKKGLKLMADLALHAIPPSFGTRKQNS